VYTDKLTGANLYLGGFPYSQRVIKDLVEQRGIQVFINVVAEKTYQVDQLRVVNVPMRDFGHPTVEQIEKGVMELETAVNAGNNVYLHCKAGKGRSATVVLCWLVKHKGMELEKAQKYLQDKRPQIVKNIFSRDVVREFVAKEN
jgi:atypical dual specificity phosphatase